MLYSFLSTFKRIKLIFFTFSTEMMLFGNDLVIRASDKTISFGITGSILSNEMCSFLAIIISKVPITPAVHSFHCTKLVSRFRSAFDFLQNITVVSQSSTGPCCQCSENEKSLDGMHC
jgi:hypothetical protein